MNPPRPRPRLDAENRAFWIGGGEGKLYIMKCGDCSEYTHPPKPLCRHCHSENVAPAAVKGTGVVHSFTINYQPWAPGLEVPLVKCEDKVRVTFEEQDGIYYPLFEKAH
jgi:uncharacterized protein